MFAKILKRSHFRNIHNVIKLVDESQMAELVLMINLMHKEIGNYKTSIQKLTVEDIFLITNQGVEIYLALNNQKQILGFISVSESSSINAGGRYGMINEIYVYPDYRNLKIASALIDFAKNMALERGWRQLLATGPGNTSWFKAIHFYSAKSFKYSGPLLQFRTYK